MPAAPRHPLLLALLALAFALPAAGCGGDDGGGGGGGGEQPKTTPEAKPQTAEGGCRDVQPPAPRPEGELEKPKGGLSANKTYELVFKTSCGEFAVELDTDVAPETTTSLVSLARRDFYDGTTFHRVVPGFVIQGGDPTGTGSGGPGYSTRDRPPRDAQYTKGVVAMAKTGQEPPGTAGSQFFVVTGEGTGLTPDYAIVGAVSRGLEVVDRIAALGTGDGPPSRPVVIEDVTVETG